MHIEEEVAILRTRLEKLEATVNRLMTRAAPEVPPEPSTNPQLRDWLMRQGVSSPPSSLEHAAAERWHTLPDEEKKRVRSELDALPPGPMVSDIVIEQRH